MMRGLIARTALVQILLAALATTALPRIVEAQAMTQAAFQARFDQALATFNSARQPESIPQFSQLIDDLRALRNRSNELTLPSPARCSTARRLARTSGRPPTPTPTCASFAKWLQTSGSPMPGFHRLS